jgi:radical SAM superfamily enzyme YgiQ (UPF0313 family)
MVGAKAFMPPQGILTIAASLPPEWSVRFADENVSAVSDSDLGWADAVLLTGMHVQRPHIERLNARAHRLGRVTALGGPSVSGCPEWYPDVDLLHIGELGDATDALVARLQRSVARPAVQEVYTTVERRPLESFPVPSYHQIDLGDYLFGSVQYSSGCPFRCEFCDIPVLYGRNPRLKTPDQVIRELDAMVERGVKDLVYFVDDNFIANPHAAVPLLRALIRWQEERRFPVDFACEATLNIVKRPEILEMMQQARFVTMFCGIETPEESALRFIHKEQNLRTPIVDSVRILNSYGIEVVAGIILGLDTDTEATYDAICRFIDASGIPILTINLLHALPRTPLWQRLADEGRLLDDAGDRESNVRFLLPYDTVVAGWRRVVAHAYAPDRLYERYRQQIRETFPNRRPLPSGTPRAELGNLRRALRMAGRVLWRVGIRSDYRGEFWRLAREAVRIGQPDATLQAAIVGYHLIGFTRDALAGRMEKAFYAPPAPVRQRVLA